MGKPYTPFVETELLLAVMSDEEERDPNERESEDVKALLDSMTEQEIRTFYNHVARLRYILHRRLGYPGSGGW